MKKIKRISMLALAFSTALTLTACQGASNDSGPALTGAWAKATDSMTGVFGELTNDTKADITVTEVASDVAGMTEMHETVTIDGSMQMQELEGGFVIPARGTHTLEPGGDHIMLMHLNRELLPGEQFDLTLKFSDGSEQVVPVEVRDFAGAIEEYAPGDHDDH